MSCLSPAESMEFIGANLALGVRVILSNLRAKFVPGPAKFYGLPSARLPSLACCSPGNLSAILLSPCLASFAK